MRRAPRCPGPDRRRDAGHRRRNQPVGDRLCAALRTRGFSRALLHPQAGAAVRRPPDHRHGVYAGGRRAGEAGRPGDAPAPGTRCWGHSGGDPFAGWQNAGPCRDDSAEACFRADFHRGRDGALFFTGCFGSLDRSRAPGGQHRGAVPDRPGPGRGGAARSADAPRRVGCAVCAGGGERGVYVLSRRVHRGGRHGGPAARPARDKRGSVHRFGHRLPGGLRGAIRAAARSAPGRRAGTSPGPARGAGNWRS